MEELYESLYGASVTVISNEFLAQYLSDTKPEYIKVFLFYLWKGIKEQYTIAEASSEIDLDEDVVEMALKYWIRKKIIKKECLGKEKNDSKKEVTNLLNFQDKKNELIKKSRKEFSEVEKNLMFVAEKLLGQLVSSSQSTLIAKCYNEYEFDESLIQYLIEYCVNKDIKDSRYMGRVAESWYEKGLKTADEAKKYVDSFEKNNIKVVKSKKNNNARELDRNDDYNKIFLSGAAKVKCKNG